MDPKTFPKPNGEFVSITGGGYAFIPYPLPPTFDQTSEILWLNSQAERELARLEGICTILPNPYLLISPFIHQEAIASSGIEETYSTITDLFVYEIENAKSAESDATKEVSNYAKAMNYGFESGRKLPFSLRLIRELHRILMDGVRGREKTPGEFRRVQVAIGSAKASLQEARLVPPPVPDMLRTLNEFELFCHTEDRIMPLIKAAMIHYQFETIHPFQDGNGRVGRLLISIYLHDMRYLSRPLLFISRYFERTRQEYYQRLQNVSESSDWNGWIAYFLRAVQEQCLRNSGTALKIIQLQKSYLKLLTESHAPARLLPVLDSLFITPATTAQILQTITKTSAPTSQTDIDLLEELGILKEVSGRRRNRIYQLEGLVKILES